MNVKSHRLAALLEALNKYGIETRLRLGSQEPKDDGLVIERLAILGAESLLSEHFSASPNVRLAALMGASKLEKL